MQTVHKHIILWSFVTALLFTISFVVFWEPSRLQAAAPNAIKLSPGHNSTTANSESGLSIDFDTEVQAMSAPANSAYINIYDITDTKNPQLLESISVNSSAISTKNNTASISHSIPFGESKTIKVIVSDNVFQSSKDLTPFAGISDGSWQFTTSTPDTTAPEISALSPTDESTSVDPSGIFRITFNETIKSGIGSAYIKDLVTDSTIQTIPSSKFQIVSNTVSFTPDSPLEEFTGYYINLDTNAVSDNSGNFFGEIAGKDTWNFTTGNSIETPPTVDSTAPKILSLSPTNGATQVTTNTKFVATFDEAILSNKSGQVLIYKKIDNKLAQISEESSITFSSDSFNFTPSGLEANTVYYINISMGFLSDTHNNAFPGVTDTSTWSFTTDAAETDDTPGTYPPKIIALSPSNGATQVPVNSTLSATFNEAISLKSGFIQILEPSTKEATQTIPLSQTSISKDGMTLNITLNKNLAYNTQYVVHIDSGMVINEALVGFAGISNDSTWSFTTESNSSESSNSGNSHGGGGGSGSNSPKAYKNVAELLLQSTSDIQITTPLEDQAPEDNKTSANVTAETISKVYVDIPTTSDVAEPLANLAQRNIFHGYPDKTFRPNNDISRYEFVVVSLRAADKEPVNIDTTTSPFKDLGDQTQQSFIARAYEEKIINGYPDKTFRPNNDISNLEATKIILNTLAPEASNYTSETNVSSKIGNKNDWAKPYIQYATDHNLISDSFNPNQSMTRKEAAQIIDKLLK